MDLILLAVVFNICHKVFHKRIYRDLWDYSNATGWSTRILGLSLISQVVSAFGIVWNSALGDRAALGISMASLLPSAAVGVYDGYRQNNPVYMRQQVLYLAICLQYLLF